MMICPTCDHGLVLTALVRVRSGQTSGGTVIVQPIARGLEVLETLEAGRSRDASGELFKLFQAAAAPRR
jgi:hypothetical protein